MKTQLPSAIILCALLLVLSLHAFAAGNQTTHVSSSGTSHGASNASALLANALGTRYTGYTITIQPTAAGEAAPTAALLSDASSRTCSAGTTVVEGETYLAAAPVLRALYPGLAVTEQADTLSAQGDDLHLEALAGEAYFTVILCPPLRPSRGGSSLLTAGYVCRGPGLHPVHGPHHRRPAPLPDRRPRHRTRLSGRGPLLALPRHLL